MSDLKLDADGDLGLDGALLSMVYDSDYRAQRLQIALRHSVGEWFRDEAQGTDYPGAIWGKSTDLQRRAEFRRRILQVPGIREILAIRLTLDPSRHLTGEIEVLQDDGTPIEVRFSGRS